MIRDDELYKTLVLPRQALILTTDLIVYTTIDSNLTHISDPMISTTVYARSHATRQASQLVKTLALSHGLYGRLGCAACKSSRHFSTTPAAQLKDFFPAKDTPQIQVTKPAWPHHGYTLDQMVSVVPAHRPPRGFGDWAAWKVVRIARFWMDLATGMGRDQQVDKKHPTTSVVADKPLTEAQWVSVPPFMSIHKYAWSNTTFNSSFDSSS